MKITKKDCLRMELEKKKKSTLFSEKNNPSDFCGVESFVVWGRPVSVEAGGESVAECESVSLLLRVLERGNSCVVDVKLKNLMAATT